MNSAVTLADAFTAAACSVVVVGRDAEWLVTNVQRATDGWFVHAQGHSELARDINVTSPPPLDHVQEAAPATPTSSPTTPRVTAIQLAEEPPTEPRG